MITNRFKSIAYGMALMGGISPHFSQADTELNFSGFATLGFSKAFIDEVDTNGNEYLDEQLNSFEGMTEDVDFRNLNRLGLRLDVPMDDSLSFTTQVIAKGKKDYKPEIDWLFMTYSFTPNVSVSVGKIRTPLFMFSDYLDVGYAYQWVSPPFSVYGAPTVNSTEGAKLSWIADLGGDWLSEVQIWSGESNETLDELNDAPFTLTDQTGIAWNLEREWLVLRGVYVQGKGTIDILALQTANAQIAAIEGGINQISAQPGVTVDAVDLSSVQDDVTYTEDKNEFFGLGFMLDFESVFIGAEASRVKSDTNLPLGDLDSYYVLTGVRLPADVTLSFTYSVDSDKEKSEIYENYQDLTRTSIAQLDATIAFLEANNPGNPGLPGMKQVRDGAVKFGTDIETTVIQQQRKERETFTLGARWDFHRQAALKAEYMLQNTTIGAQEEVSPKAVRLAIDLIF